MAKDKVYTAEMGKPPQDIDGKSAGKVNKKDMPEQPGSGIRVDGKPLKDETPTKMRRPTSSETSAIELGRSQNRLAKEYEDAKNPKNLNEEIRKSVMPDKLRKEAGKNFQKIPEEVRDYEAYKDAGYKKGGKITASSRADGIAQRGKTRGKMV